MAQEKVDPALEAIGHSDNVARLRNVPGADVHRHPGAPRGMGARRRRPLALRRRRRLRGREPARPRRRGVPGPRRPPPRGPTSWIEPFEAVTLELEEIIGTGDRLVSVHRTYARARDVDIELAGAACLRLDLPRGPGRSLPLDSRSRWGARGGGPERRRRQNAALAVRLSRSCARVAWRSIRRRDRGRS